jgi:hypothetical protein
VQTCWCSTICVQVAAHLPLSVPSSLPRQALDVAVRSIVEPYSEGVVPWWVDQWTVGWLGSFVLVDMFVTS